MYDLTCQIYRYDFINQTEYSCGYKRNSARNISFKKLIKYFVCIMILKLLIKMKTVITRTHSKPKTVRNLQQ